MEQALRRALAVLASLVLVGAACGDGDGDGSDVAAYCELVEELNEGGEPDLDQLDDLTDLAPEEIRDDIQTVRDELEELGDAGGRPSAEATEAIAKIVEFDQEHCGDGVDQA